MPIDTRWNPRRALGRLGLAGLLSLAGACQPSSVKADGGGVGGGFQPAAHEPLPLVPKGGGAIFSAVQLVTVTFDGDPNQKALEAFSGWLVQSSWLQTVGAQYGVGTGTNVDAELSDPPPADPVNDMEEYLGLELRAGNLPSPGPQTLYLVYLPQAASACSEVIGYHSSFPQTPTRPVVYGVTSNCPTGALTGLQEEELEASHELIESVTDPLYDPSSPSATAGYQILDPANPFSAWGGAVAELCAFPTSPTPPVVDGPTGYLTTRVWSNSAASADGEQPCAPSWTQSYFNVSPSPDTPQVVSAGASATFVLTGWSAEPLAAPWTIQVVPSGQGFTPVLSFAEATIQNGQTLTLTVTVPAGAASGAQTIVYVYSGSAPMPPNGWTPDAGTPYVGYWPLVIAVQ
ncbi:MAG: hypothetical protein ACYDCL_05600 [Myxococcales bacterium]